MKKQTYRLVNKSVMMNASVMLHNLPVDGSIEVIYREYKKPSSQAQRRLMFGYLLDDITEQAWVSGRQFSKIAWHEFFKQQFLPESYTEGETLEGYEKWIETPTGELRMVGSTTKLTTKGQVNYTERIAAYALQELGVQFSAYHE